MTDKELLKEHVNGDYPVNGEPALLACRHCGHRGGDVEYQNSYIGGQGYKHIPLCLDRVACWHRWHQGRDPQSAKELEDLMAMREADSGR
jgi:hypothetical protein